MVKVKICGITNLEDAIMSIEYGADALGFIFAPSKRQAHPDTVKSIIAAIPPFVSTVGVFMDQSVDEMEALQKKCKFQWVQLHGSESKAIAARFAPFVIKAIFNSNEAVENYPCCAFLLDQSKDGEKMEEEEYLRLASSVRTSKPLILSGGITPENVHKFTALNPYALDVASGVEMEPGKKDRVKVRTFIEKAKQVC